MLFKNHLKSFLVVSGLGVPPELPCLPQVILMDLMMPEMSGDEILSKLKRDPTTSEIPVIMMTADTRVSTKIKLLELGASDVISKPYVLKELLENVKKFLLETLPVQHQELPPTESV